MANELVELYGKRGKPTQNAHKQIYGDHVDYNPTTNEARMQLVTTVDHEATFHTVVQ